ncbi:GDSL-type esterase/lipase family protein [Arenibaculum pallidiluteum]|uniref:GDSL-type esterase/lipase family protein n=1 Tax=Arenibaculum pallidiluteum TaxID=2812559 RepID=UPI001A97A306|nr:GDSL-type esterase/lipase family protein [Arenibaculum pallidiluteum]
MRICFIGDSFVNGTGDDACLGWVGRIGAAMRAAGCDVTLYNLGVRRDTSADIALRWRREAEARLPADQDGRLVFSFGANDCAAGDDGAARLPLSVSLANAGAILAAARAWRPTLMLGPLPVGDAGTDPRIGILSRELGPLCARLDVPYLAVFDAMRACAPWRDEAAAGDGSHPGAKGYAALAELVGSWAALRDWMAASATER